MTPGEFLRSVWPSDGVYCLAYPLKQGGWRHRTCKSIDEIERYVAEAGRSTDVYFNVHTLKAESVWNERLQKNQTRTQANAHSAKAYFFDLDVGAGDKKYPTQAAALVALRQFCEDAKLPRPLLTSSGGGIHVYWLLSEAVPSDEWRDTATRLRQLADHYGLKADPMRTTDTASLLRVVGTFNLKNPAEPRPVLCLKEGVVTAPGVFAKLVSDAVIVTGAVPRLAAKVFQAEQTGLGSNVADQPYDGPTPNARAVFTACPQMARLAMLRGQFSEPEWYHAVIGVGRFTEHGNRTVHKLSAGHSGYTEAACNTKIKQSEAVQPAPSSCASIARVSDVGDSLCVDCPFNGKVWGPIQAAIYKDPAPAPSVLTDIGTEIIETPIPDPPEPYTRMKSGGVAFVAKNKDGDEQHLQIIDYDLYPVRRMTNAVVQVEQTSWYANLPNTKESLKTFTLDSDALYDTRKFTHAISNKGLYPAKGNIQHLQDYMVAYISKLQREAEADSQCNHLGWSDDYTRFIFPDKIICADGTARMASLSTGASRSAANVTRKGSLEEQVRLLRFYSRPEYVPNQFFILAGLAAPLFFLTGHHGVIVNASGDAGASKSTSLYTAASFWGQPELYPINGTNNGATVRGRNERVTVLANLPICVDEITHMPVKDAVDLAMSITQPGHRIRLETSGVERASIDSYKATIMLTTANNSLHSTLSIDNTAGTAGSMRVFEIQFRATTCHKKHEADDYLYGIKENFGWIGEAFVTYCLKNLSAVRERVRQKIKAVDIACDIRGSERFWSATIGVILVAGEIASELGLLSFHMKLIEEWATGHQITQMRGVVRDEYADPLGILGNYLAMVTPNMVATEKQRVGHTVLVHERIEPRGALLAHYDMTDGVMYILKQGFKDYCSRIGANAHKIVEGLSAGGGGTAKVIPVANIKRTLGAGTKYAKGQAWCFSVNMKHQDVSGLVDLTVVEADKGGETVTNLRSVQ